MPKAKEETTVETNPELAEKPTQEVKLKPKKQKKSAPPVSPKIAYRATGRRKEAVARVRLLPGKGNFEINGKTLEGFFGREIICQTVRKPLLITGTLNKFDIVALVIGGGVSGQAGAVQHGIARALLEVDETLRNSLKRAGFLTRDPRMKERRKYGLKKARKRPQYSKR